MERRATRCDRKGSVVAIDVAWSVVAGIVVVGAEVECYGGCN